MSVPLSLAAIFILAAFIPAQIAKDKKLIEDNLKSTAQIKSNLRNPGHIEKAKEEADKEEAKKAVVWAQAYKEQEGLATWPAEIENKYGFSNGLFAVEVKMSANDPAGADSDRMFHGRVEKADKEKIVVKPAKGDAKTFYKTADSRLRVSDEGNKSNWFEIAPGKFVAITYERWKNFNDQLTKEEQEEFKNAYQNYDYLNDILKQVDPVRENGKGVVQLRGWLWQQGGRKPRDGSKFISFFPKEWDLTRDISEEAWIVMEDMWIQQELYRLIRLANDYVGKFKPDYLVEFKKKENYANLQKAILDKNQGPKTDPSNPDDMGEKDKKEIGKIDGEGKAELPKKDKAEKNWVGEDVNFGELTGHTFEFENPYWRLRLNLIEENGKREKLSVIIKNLLGRRQRLELSFLVKLHKGSPAEEITLPPAKSQPDAGEPLAPTGSPGDERQFTIQLSPNVPRQGVFGVEQVLTWETAAVKRIDEVLIGAPDRQSHSHRTYPKSLRPYREVAPKPDANTQEGPGGGKGPGNPPVNPPGKGASDKGMPNIPKDFGKGGGGGGQTGPNGIQKVRYLEVSEQSRRLPVAISLIVDQDSVDRVQTAFGNSKIRFLTTQVLLNRYPSSIRPPIVVETKGSDKKSTDLPKGPGGQPDKGGVVLPGGGNPGGGSPSVASSGEDLEGNVEMVIYGIVTLYERYPPRPGGTPP